MRFPQAVCAVFLACAALLHAAELKPITGETSLTNSGGGGVWTETVGRHTMELRFMLEARYRFHAFGGEPTRLLSTRFVLDSVSVSPPITYTDPSTKRTYSAPAQFTSAQAADYGADNAFDRIKVNDLTLTATLSAGGANAATTIPGRGLLFGEQGRWSMDSTASPSWDKFLDGLDPETAKEIYRTLLESGDVCSVKMVADDLAFSGLIDFRNAIENSLRAQAKNDALAILAPAAAAREERAEPEPSARSSTPAPGRGSQPAAPAWRGYSGIDRKALEPGRNAIAEALRRRAELARRRKEESMSSRAASADHSAPPGGSPTSGRVFGISEMDRMYGDNPDGTSGGKPGVSENARTGRTEQSSAAPDRARVGSGLLKQALGRANAARAVQAEAESKKRIQEVEAREAARQPKTIRPLARASSERQEVPNVKCPVCGWYHEPPGSLRLLSESRGPSFHYKRYCDGTKAFEERLR